MLDLNDFAVYLLGKKTKPRIEVKGNNMILFYTDTLKIIERHMAMIVKKKAAPKSILTEYVSLVNNGYNSADLEIQRCYLIDDLRHLILSTLIRSTKEDRKILKTYHSILHLMALVKCKNISYYSILNEWLNSNNVLDDSDVCLHAMRGNFGKVVDFYPQTREAIEAYLSLEKRFNNEKLAEEEYNCEFEDWKKNYSWLLPKELRNIFFGNLKKGDEDWVEYLCYQLIYVKRDKGAFISDKSQIKEFIEEDDEIAHILLENHKRLIEQSKGWIRLILLFLCKYDDKNVVFEAFESVAQSIYKLDWRLCLDYFAYTPKAKFQFNYIANCITLSPLNLEFLIRFSKKCEIDNSFVLNSFCVDALKSKEYTLLLRAMCQYKYFKVEYTEEFMRYCVENYSCLALNPTFMKTEAGNFIRIYKKLAGDTEDMSSFFSNIENIGCDDSFETCLEDKVYENNTIPKLKESKSCENICEEEILFCLNSKYLQMFKYEIIMLILTRFDLTQNVLYKCLGILIESEETKVEFKEKNLKYQKIIFERFNEIGKKNNENGKSIFNSAC